MYVCMFVRVASATCCLHIEQAHAEKHSLRDMAPLVTLTFQIDKIPSNSLINWPFKLMRIRWLSNWRDSLTFKSAGFADVTLCAISHKLLMPWILLSARGSDAVDVTKITQSQTRLCYLAVWCHYCTCGFDMYVLTYDSVPKRSAPSALRSLLMQRQDTVPTHLNII